MAGNATRRAARFVLREGALSVPLSARLSGFLLYQPPPAIPSVQPFPAAPNGTSLGASGNAVEQLQCSRESGYLDAQRGRSRCGQNAGWGGSSWVHVERRCGARQDSGGNAAWHVGAVRRKFVAPSATRMGNHGTEAPSPSADVAGLARCLKVLGVVGAGQMGSGIAQLGAVAGMEVVLCDRGQAELDRGLNRIHSSLDRLVKKGRLTQDEAGRAVGLIQTSEDVEALGSAEYVVEAVAEDPDLKRTLFGRLDSVTKPATVLASNTSSISITLIGAATSRPEKVIGMHFMNPPPIMNLVEIVNGLATDKHATQLTQSLAARFGKTVCFARDHPGFIVNRLLMPMINEAFYALLEGVGTAEDIDIGMKLGSNQPMGPLTLADFIGLDTCVAIMRVLHTRLGDAKYRPCPLLVQYVDAGWLGRKSGRGVYLYPAES